MSKEKFKRGSEWRKWDLHVHTQGTQKGDQFEEKDFDKFCKIFFEKALKKDISVIGVTDYFNIENYKKVLGYQKNINNTDFTDDDKEKIQNIFLLPNVELRILPVTDSNKLINIHCIFNPEYVDNLENDFFTTIEFKSGDKKYKMNRSGFIALGKDTDKNLTDENDKYTKGISQFVVNIEFLQNLITGKAFRENTLIVVSNSSNDGASGLEKHNKKENTKTLRESIYKLSDAIFSSNERDREYFLGLKKDCPSEMVIEEVGSLKPCIHGSDAHKEDKLFNPDKNRFCWIKADPTFEGLKQIIYEPESRVRIQDVKPEDKAGYQIIDSIQIENHQDFTDQTIYLNENLNCIIGGRSTGKSILLGTIAKKLNSEEEKFTITWKDGENEKDRGIKYIPQSYMYDIARDNNKFNELISGIIKQDKEKQNQLDENKTFEGNNKTTINKNINRLIQLQEKLLENEKISKETGDKKGIEEEIKKLNEQLSQLKTTLSDEEIKTYNEEKNNLEKLINENKNLEIEISKIQSLKNKLFINSDIETEFISLNENNKKSISEIFTTVKNNFEKEWKLELDKIITNNNDTLKENETKKINIKNNKIFEKGEIFSNDNKSYKEIEEKLKAENEKLNQVNNFEKEITNSKTNINSLEKKIKNNHKEFLTKLEEVKNKLDEKNEKDNLKIVASVKLDSEKLKVDLSDNINQKSSENKELIDKEFENNNEYFEHINNLFDKFLKKEITLKQNKDHYTILIKLISTNYFEISYDVIYEKDNFNQMSEGKMAFVVLKLLLDFSNETYPILIDQPEDDLDNRAIYVDLVKYLKQKKTERQIIVVTHNPNIVVGADAENVIVANQDGNNAKNKDDKKFQYINGSLENTSSKNEKEDIILRSQGIKEHTCEILEGGNEAFKKRENKYNLD